MLNTHRLHARNCISEPRTVTLNGYSLTHSLSECTNSGPDQIRTTMSYYGMSRRDAGNAGAKVQA